MLYVVEDYYLSGIPQTALVGGLASRGIGEHWSAGKPGREGARATARWFIDSAERNASYHSLRWWEAGTRTYGVTRIVPSTRAAHSFNPNPPDWAPNAEVRRILGDRVGDPNAVTYATAFAGMPADLEAAMQDPYFVECEVRYRRELLAQEPTIEVERPLFNHGWGQPSTRSDAGPALIPAIYRALYPETGGNEMGRPWRPRTETWTTGIGPDKGRFTVGTEEKHFTEATEITTCLEQFEVVNGVLTTPLDRLLMALYPDPVSGPEVLVIPRSSLNSPRDGRPGLPSASTAEVEKLQSALDTANKRTGSIKTTAADFLRRGAAANRDTAAGLEAAAKNVESL